MINKKHSAILLTALGLAGPVAALAAPVTYDFAGTGKVCTYSGVGTVGTCEDGKSFTGSVVIDVIAPGPAGFDGNTNGLTWADDLSGWATSDFTIQWDGHTFNPEIRENVVWDWNDTQVLNNYYGVDGLTNTEQYEGRVDGSENVWWKSSAGLYRQSHDLNWLNDLNFNTLLTLAPGADPLNRIYFENKTTSYAVEGNDWLGYSGEFNLTSMSVRPAASVPEPGTLALLGAGMAAIGYVRRRRNVTA